jgi:uncharacterized protein
MVRIAGYYRFGLAGYPVDCAESMRWDLMAADAGDTTGMDNIGLLYQNGQGVPQNHTEAGRWFRKAADLGDAGRMRIRPLG